MISALLAEDPAPAAQQMPFFMNPIFLIVIFALFWLVFVLPMTRRQKKEQQAMIAGLKRGAKVLTSAGIVGTVVGAKDGEDEVVIRSEDTRLRIKRSTVVQILGSDESEAGK